LQYLIPGFYTSIQFIVLIGLGFIIRRTGLVNGNFQKSVSTFLVKVAMPVYFFTNMGKADITFLKGSLFMPLAAMAVPAISILSAFIIFRFISLPLKEKRASLALSAFGNAGYIPLSLLEILPLTMPLLASVYNFEKAVVFIGVYLFIYSPLLWSFGNFLIARSNVKFSFKELLSPSLYGIMAGLLIPLLNLQNFVFDPALPVVYIYKALERLGSVLTPLILVNLGAMIAGIRLHSSVKKQMNVVLAGVAAVHYLIMPAVFYLLYFLVLRHINLDKTIIFVLFLEFHIPPANNLSTMAMDAGINEDLTAYVLLVTYILYVLLLPVFLIFFSSLPH